MTTITETFVDNILAIRYPSGPRDAVEIAKQVALDGLAVIHAEKAARRMLDLAEQLESLPDVAEIMDIARCDKAPA